MKVEVGSCHDKGYKNQTPPSAGPVSLPRAMVLQFTGAPPAPKLEGGGVVRWPLLWGNKGAEENKRAKEGKKSKFDGKLISVKSIRIQPGLSENVTPNQ